MLYGLLADLVLVTHLAFVGFVVFGGFLVLRWRRLADRRPGRRGNQERQVPLGRPGFVPVSVRDPGGQHHQSPRSRFMAPSST